MRNLLALSDQPETTCSAPDSIARQQLASVDARIAQLTALRGELDRMIRNCAGVKVADCPVNESLSDHVQSDGAHGAHGM